MSSHVHEFNQFWTHYLDVQGEDIHSSNDDPCEGYYYWQCVCGEYGYPVPSGSATPVPLGA